MAIERRIAAGKAEVRKTGDVTQIIGHGAVFGVEAIIGNNFRERIMPGAFAGILAASPDVRSLFNHDSNFLLGRSTAGTLALSEDATGLRYEVTPPASRGDVLESVTRGDVTGSSFGFQVKRDEWTKPARAGELPLRTIHEFAELLDVGPVTFPAYNEATAEARSVAAALLNDAPGSPLIALRVDDKNTTASGKAGKHYAGTDGASFPITDPVDVDNAAHALGRTKQDKTKVKANIIRIAYEMGPAYVAQLPNDWKKPEDQSHAAVVASELRALVLQLERRVGRVLSAANETDLTTARDLVDGVVQQVKADRQGAPGTESRQELAARAALSPEQGEEAAELVQYQTAVDALVQAQAALASALDIVDGLVADEVESPTETAEQEAAEEEVETARLRALLVLCRQVCGAVGAVSALASAMLSDEYDPILYARSAATTADEDRARRLRLVVASH